MLNFSKIFMHYTLKSKLKSISLLILALLFTVECISATSKRKYNAVYCVASDVRSPKVQFPTTKRIPLGWKAFPVASNGAVTHLNFPKLKPDSKQLWLRITAAMDFREKFLINVILPSTRQIIGQFDLRYSHPFQPFQISIDPIYLKAINENGIALKMLKGKSDAWFFMPDKKQKDSKGLQPHILIPSRIDKNDAFQNNVLSMNSLAPFGWIGGCVMDALLERSIQGDKKAESILKNQLACFLDSENGISFESPMTEPRDGKFNSIEDFLPFAAIANLYPSHPSVQMALDFLKKKELASGEIASWNELSTEGAYCVAYPLAAIAVQRNDQALAQKALNQLLHRIKLLHTNGNIYQRSTLEGHRGFANWGRGVAWYLLGMAKTIKTIQKGQFKNLNGIDSIIKEYQRAVDLVCKCQNEEGLWYSYIDRPETGIEASGSAGIATAIAEGVQLGWLDKSYIAKIKRTNQSLTELITPDGFLTNVSQLNRGGEAFQANGYRVISQFGMGLLAQLKFNIYLIETSDK
jgi:unsaturated rhamnogalacturonyl hydrolase